MDRRLFVEYKHIVFSGHAIRQMFRRGLEKDNVLTVIQAGDIVVDYPEDKPYPSCLILGFVKNEPIHVVFAIDTDQQIGIVITAYIPDTKLWTEDFRSRKEVQ
ncbi:MAG: DUF4258 domain-containing protein [Planctomycetota bacterium]|jgi:hypothetical protein